MNRAITLFLLAALSVLPVLSALRQGGHKTSEATNANETLTLELALEVDMMRCMPLARSVMRDFWCR